MAIHGQDVKGFFVRAFTENLRLKLMALVVTLALFVIVRFQEKVDRWIDVEVAVMRPTAKSGLVVTSDVPDKVRVSLRGRTSVIKAVKSGDAGQVVMDLSQRASDGSFTFYFEPEMFDFPSGVEILHINPESVPVRVEKIVSRRVGVNVQTAGRVKAGLEIEGAPIAVPPEATISGPSSVVAGVASLDTEPIDVSRLGVGEHEVHVSLKRIGGVLVKYVDKLSIVIKVRYTAGERTIPELAVRVGGPSRPPGTEDIRPPVVTATLSGPQILLERLDPSTIAPTATFDASNGQRGPFLAPIQIDGLPRGVEVKAIDPPAVKVRFSQAPAR